MYRSALFTDASRGNTDALLLYVLNIHYTPDSCTSYSMSALVTTGLHNDRMLLAV